MQRRQFLNRSLAAAAATAVGATSTATLRAQTSRQTQEFYELRTYVIASAELQQLMSKYVAEGLLPALNRQGLNRIGVFTTLPAEGQEPDFNLRVLIPYPTLDLLLSQRAALASDKAYQQAAAEYLAQPLKTPAFARINSRLMRAFAGMPVIEMPAQTASRAPRMFELRTYESHNEDAAARKVEMFNSGEIQLMRDVQMAPVFYGETLIGDNVPNLTYMLSASDMDAHKAHWDAFIKHPEWQRIKVLDKYKDTVSKIDKWFLAPAECSQI